MDEVPRRGAARRGQGRATARRAGGRGGGRVGLRRRAGKPAGEHRGHRRHGHRRPVPGDQGGHRRVRGRRRGARARRRWSGAAASASRSPAAAQQEVRESHCREPHASEARRTRHAGRRTSGGGQPIRDRCVDSGADARRDAVRRSSRRRSRHRRDVRRRTRATIRSTSSPGDVRPSVDRGSRPLGPAGLQQVGRRPMAADSQGTSCGRVDGQGVVLARASTHEHDARALHRRRTWRPVRDVVRHSARAPPRVEIADDRGAVDSAGRVEFLASVS